MEDQYSQYNRLDNSFLPATMFHRFCLVISKYVRTISKTSRGLITTKTSSARTGTRTKSKIVENRVLLDLSSTHYNHTRIETAVITGLAGEVVGRKAAADFAIMRDPDLNPKSVYNLGHIQQRNVNVMVHVMSPIPTSYSQTLSILPLVCQYLVVHGLLMIPKLCIGFLRLMWNHLTSKLWT